MSNHEDQRAPGERREGPAVATATGDDRRNVVADRRASANRQLATIYIEGQHLAIEVETVQEIVLHQQITPIPTAAEHVSGLINLRGQIVTAIDLRLLLGYPPREDSRDAMNLIIKVEGELVSLLFDKVGDVLDVAEHMFEPPPTSLDPELRKYVHKVVKLEDHLILLINVEKAAGV